MNKISAQIISTVCLSSSLGTLSLPAHAQQSANLTKIPTSEIKNDKGIEETYTKKLSNNTHNFFQNFLRVIGGNFDAVDELEENIEEFVFSLAGNNTDYLDKNLDKDLDFYNKINIIVLIASSITVVYTVLFSLLTRLLAKLILKRKIRESERVTKQCRVMMKQLKLYKMKKKDLRNKLKNKLRQYIEIARKFKDEPRGVRHELESLKKEYKNELNNYKKLSLKTKIVRSVAEKADIAKSIFRSLQNNLNEYRDLTGIDVICTDTFYGWDPEPQQLLKLL